MTSIKMASLTAALLLIAAPAAAGSCRYGSFGGRSTVACTDGYFEATDSRGHRRSYGFRNGGFRRYPDSYLPRYANEHYH